ncbi:Uncharacterised protein [Mycobacteroides abscessus subsp. abscessus]|nr:Uncharacterised protein [Mycobacteroides abscessus subsp. abscessus]SIC76223.1 Uncharacterised protein [Mycobacteroides abscessus subsp. abscessus]SKP28416.1 Uncharacterised protein [Mycobacteroides abscessus subsp. abscessus]
MNELESPGFSRGEDVNWIRLTTCSFRSAIGSHEEVYMPIERDSGHRVRATSVVGGGCELPGLTG